MITVLLDAIPLWLLVLCLGLLLWSALEGGFRFGVWRKEKAPGEHEQAVGAIVASIIGLLALVLGFTFSFAASRFEARRQVALQEANAIGTTWLRTTFLPEPLRQPAQQALREYVDVRIEGVRSGDPTAAIARSEKLQEILWQQATEAGRQNPTSEMVGLYVNSLNSLIDLHAERIQVALRTRIPLTIWIALVAMALLSMAAVGYQSGLAKTRRSPVMAVMILAFTIVLALIADLDRSQQGLLRVSQQALVDVQTMMKTPLP